jgi:hypothetical protein
MVNCSSPARSGMEKSRIGLPSRQTTLHRPFHDGVNLVPAQMQLFGHCLLTGLFQPGNGQALH